MGEKQAGMVTDAVAARRKCFVDAAAASFFEHGYAGTTMSSIAQRVGGSKTTLWSYFPAKEQLFAAVVDDIVDIYGTALQMDLPLDVPVMTVLETFANALVNSLLQPPIMSLHRLVSGEAGRFPHLAQLFYDRGPKRGRQRLTDYMAAKMQQAELRAGDPSAASQQFFGLCQASIYEYTVLNMPLDENGGRVTIEADLSLALDSFGRAWAVKC